MFTLLKKINGTFVELI